MSRVSESDRKYAIYGWMCPRCNGLITTIESWPAQTDQCRLYCQRCNIKVVIKTHDLCDACDARVECLGLSQAIRKLLD
jgi:hypothetical protein